MTQIADFTPSDPVEQNPTPRSRVWSPSVCTPPLSADFTTDGDRLLALIDVIWPFPLDEWQRDLIRRVLETYPPDWPEERLRGRLRWSSGCVICMGRQNGKSELGAIFALYGLIYQPVREPKVIGLARDKDQADQIFSRTRVAIESQDALKKRFKTTRYRGISSKNDATPASYVMKASVDEGLQGIPITTCLFDEVHLVKEDVWDAVLLGMSAQTNPLLLGITTAGDENSDLLKRLYKTGRQAAAQTGDYDDRFGFFLWEAPDGCDLYDPDALRAANPAIACGRMDVNDTIRVLKTMSPTNVRRYRLNQFVETGDAPWMKGDVWGALDRSTGHLPEGGQLYISVERSIKNEFATFVASKKIGDKVYTKVIAAIRKPNIEKLESAALWLWARHRPVKFFMPSATLKVLADHLREQGIPVEYLTALQMVDVCSQSYSLIAEKRVDIAADQMVDLQSRRAVAKSNGDGERIFAKNSVGDVDSFVATLIGIWAAETTVVRNDEMIVIPPVRRAS